MEKIGQDQMLSQFKERYTGLINENQQLAEKIKQNEVQALKLQGAINPMEPLPPPKTSI